MVAFRYVESYKIELLTLIQKEVNTYHHFKSPVLLNVYTFNKYINSKDDNNKFPWKSIADFKVKIPPISISEYINDNIREKFGENDKHPYHKKLYSIYNMEPDIINIEERFNKSSDCVNYLGKKK